MPRVPDAAAFECLSCRKMYHCDPRKDNHFFPWMRRLPIQQNGRCRHCGGESWNLVVVYFEEDREWATDPGSWLLGFVTSSIPFKHSIASSKVVIPRVSPQDVAWMNADPQRRTVRVGLYTDLCQRSQMKEKGAKRCQACGGTFFVQSGIVWTEKGYCSKLCLVQQEGQGTLSEDKIRVSHGSSKVVRVICGCGHPFDVAKTFCGTKRTCPQCGEKVAVPPS